MKHMEGFDWLNCVHVIGAADCMHFKSPGRLQCDESLLPKNCKETSMRGITFFWKLTFIYINNNVVILDLLV